MFSWTSKKIILWIPPSIWSYVHVSQIVFLLQELEEKFSAQQREKSASLMEKQLLKDSLAQKEHQCELETQVSHILNIALDEEVIQTHIFLISSWKHVMILN